MGVTTVIKVSNGEQFAIFTLECPIRTYCAHGCLQSYKQCRHADEKIQRYIISGDSCFIEFNCNYVSP